MCMHACTFKQILDLIKKNRLNFIGFAISVISPYLEKHFPRYIKITFLVIYRLKNRLKYLLLLKLSSKHVDKYSPIVINKLYC